eukprot:260080-Amphidinium_carterae.1
MLRVYYAPRPVGAIRPKSHRESTNMDELIGQRLNDVLVLNVECAWSLYRSAARLCSRRLLVKGCGFSIVGEFVDEVQVS